MQHVGFFPSVLKFFFNSGEFSYSMSCTGLFGIVVCFVAISDFV